MLPFFDDDKNNATSGTSFIELRKQVIAPFISECMCSTKVDPFLIDDWYNKGIFVNNPCFKCFVKCIGQKINFMNSDGSYRNNEIIKSYHASLELARNCTLKVTNVTDLCEKGYIHAQCVVNVLINT
ncbi:hypothetical protein RN001_015100 [Aquatica leii]|uniref:Uncharacterized protein n=1 Tax=Aquatica leii TaxID=1421715 RepID=A0AAN7P0J3_9COLE|nr:hypothetical protein RN001_015100 [Aquatica leii]